MKLANKAVYYASIALFGVTLLIGSNLARKIPNNGSVCRNNEELKLAKKCGGHSFKSTTGNIKRILNGDMAKLGDFPSYVFLRVLWSNISRCSGVIIGDDLILTAAHCVMESSNVRVFHGTVLYGAWETSDLGFISEVKKVCSSKKFKLNTRPNGIIGATHDIAILKADRKYSFNSTFQPACLPKEELEMGAQSYIVGLNGYAQYETLLTYMQAKRSECLWEDEKNDASLLCALATNPKSTPCAGDSGGPLIAIKDGKQFVHGIISYGEDESCREGNYTHYQANTYEMREEIKELIKECNS